MRKVQKELLDKCSVCDSKNLVEFLSLPAFPQIGIYLDLSSSEDQYPCVDNSLMICDACGHVQMEYALDPVFLYDTSFQHKTSQSASAKQANIFLFDVIKKHYPNLQSKSIAEVGCNDTFFLRKFVEDFGCTAVGVDPTLQGNEEAFLNDLDPDIASRFSVIGEFIEDVDFTSRLGFSPDIVVSNFVFEHLKHPKLVAESMLKCVSDTGICAIGVPTLEFMSFNCRFDQMSHQHYQQFSVRALHQLVEGLGAKVIACETNFTNWGQTVIIFQKGDKPSEQYLNFHRFTLGELQASLDIFKRDIETMKIKLDHLTRGRKIYGFGAAQNFPIFHYFAGKDLPINIILDDHPQRQDKKFPYVDNMVTAKPEACYNGAVSLLTGPDYARVLFKRIGELNFDHIISPFSSY